MKKTYRLNDLIGKKVRITWKSQDYDWLWYTILGIDQGWILLRGNPDPLGNPYNGEPFWNPMSEIDIIEEREKKP